MSKLDKLYEQIEYHRQLKHDEYPFKRLVGQDFERASNAMRVIVDSLNAGDKNAVVIGILDGLLGSHRYLQNSAILALLEALGTWSDLPRDEVTDARNLHSHEICGLARKAIEHRMCFPDERWK